MFQIGFEFIKNKTPEITLSKYPSKSVKNVTLFNVYESNAE